MAYRLLSLAAVLLGFSSISNASPTPVAAPATTTPALLPRTMSDPFKNTTQSSSSAAATHTVQVGKATNAFTPDIVQANVGDVVEFDFYPANHSVIRAAYKYPCIPYEDVIPDGVGFFSGFQPVDVILSEPPNWSVRINDTDPVFFYCGAPGSCIDFQMVGVINPNASVSLVMQKQLAKDSSYMLEPGQDFPAEASASISSLAAAATATAAAASTASASSTPTTSNHTLSTGAIAGIAIGGAAVLVLAAALFYFIGRDKRRSTDPDNRQSMQILGGGGAQPDMIQRDGVLYAPVGHAAPEYPTGSGHTSMVLPPVYDPLKSPVATAHPAGFRPIVSPSPRSASPTGSGLGAETHSMFTGSPEIPQQRMSMQKSPAETRRNSSRRRIHEMFAPLPGQGPSQSLL